MNSGIIVKEIAVLNRLEVSHRNTHWSTNRAWQNEIL